MITLTSNWRKGCVISTTLRKQAKYLSKIISPYLKSRLFWHYFWNFGLPRFVLSRFLFRGMVWNEIPTVCFYICSMERNSELFSLLLKGSTGNSESMLLFLFPRNGIRSCFLFRGRVRNGIPRFLFRGTAGIPSEITICSVFRGIIFLSEIPNPTCECYGSQEHICDVNKSPCRAYVNFFYRTVQSTSATSASLHLQTIWLLLSQFSNIFSQHAAATGPTHRLLFKLNLYW